MAMKWYSAFPKPQDDGSLAIKLFNVISKTLVKYGGGILILYRDATGLFYGPSWPGYQRWRWYTVCVEKEGERERTRRTESSVNGSIHWLEDYIGSDCRGQERYRKYKHQPYKNIQKNKMGRKNSMDISSDKQARSHTRKLGHGWDRETLKEEVNLFW